jgi:hypothetical protein
LLIVCLLPNPREDIGDTINRFFIFSSPVYLSLKSHNRVPIDRKKATRRIYAIISKSDTRFLWSCPTSFCSRSRRKILRLQGRFLEKGQSFRIEDAQTVLRPAFQRPLSLGLTVNQKPDKTGAINITQIHL